jgi:hypothetical protein
MISRSVLINEQPTCLDVLVRASQPSLSSPLTQELVSPFVWPLPFSFCCVKYTMNGDGVRSQSHHKNSCAHTKRSPCASRRETLLVAQLYVLLDKLSAWLTRWLSRLKRKAPGEREESAAVIRGRLPDDGKQRAALCPAHACIA